MGQEISSTTFSKEDEAKFHERLREETKLLKKIFDSNGFSDLPPQCGIELEAWLVTNDFVPSPNSAHFLNQLNNPLVVPEISTFNFELNSRPRSIKGTVFSKLEDETYKLWKKCEDIAEKSNQRALLIGTLPTLREHMLSMDILSPQKRYKALNDRVMELRGNAPVKISLQGKDDIHLEHNNVITECAATSLQIHFEVTQENGPSYYNASIVASAFVAATGANSPFFFGKELWDESRIPIFEKAVNLKAFQKIDGDHATRVSLGNGYVRNSLLELFIENLDGYPILLPELMESPPEKLKHLCLQNGTIWRWNRALIGFQQDGKPGLRLEFRVPSSGPTVKDGIANTFFQIALTQYLSKIENLTEFLSFKDAEKNFYEACRYGLNADIKWIDGKTHNIQELLLDKIIPELGSAATDLGIDEDDTHKYIDDIIRCRVKNGQNGASWQKAFIHTHGARFQDMLEAYYSFQRKNIPVHKWTV